MPCLNPFSTLWKSHFLIQPSRWSPSQCLCIGQVSSMSPASWKPHFLIQYSWWSPSWWYCTCQVTPLQILSACPLRLFPQLLFLQKLGDFLILASLFSLVLLVGLSQHFFLQLLFLNFWYFISGAEESIPSSDFLSFQPSLLSFSSFWNMFLPSLL